MMTAMHISRPDLTLGPCGAAAGQRERRRVHRAAAEPEEVGGDVGASNGLGAASSRRLTPDFGPFWSIFLSFSSRS